jgi:hypothetical protein
VLLAVPANDQRTIDVRETYPMQDRVAAAAGWDDPAMDDYDTHRKTK